MTAIASPEFVSLCRAQLRLLTQQMAESSAALYIADIADIAEQVNHQGQSNFVPVVSYPEPVDRWVANFTRATPWATDSYSSPLALPAADSLPAVSDISAAETAPDQLPDWLETAEFTEPADTSTEAQPHFDWPEILHPEQQLVVPLVYTEVVVGLLVTVRPDRAWKSEERRHIETVAESLAAGCVLERRNQWLQRQLARKRSLQSRQSELFHNLLHQFRNPLTAVGTFGQLLVRRLEPEDANQTVATGVVRETKRLRELVTHFDQAVAIGDADLAVDSAPAALLPTAQRLLSPQRPMVPQRTDGALGGVSDDSSRGSTSSAGSPSDAQTADQAVDWSELGQPLSLSAQYLPDIVEPILAVADIVATEKGIDLQTQVAADTPSVWGEEEALGEVVSNLVDNAIKYSPAGALVWVQTGVSRVSEADHYQGIVVGDTGAGIPADDQARLFERYYRGVQAQGDIPGTGLGLAIAQSLMQEMHGFIEVISPATGTPWMPRKISRERQAGAGLGTVFIVWLLEVDRP